MILLGGVLSGAAGSAVGSYVGAAALRATRGESAMGGRSRCDGCRRSLGAFETVPFVSYAVARGRCAACGVRIAKVHLAAELAGAGVAIALWSAPTATAGGLMAVMAAALLAASVIDLRTLKLPNLLTALVALSAAALAMRHGGFALVEGLVAACAALLILLGVRWAASGRDGEPGVGLGDVKLIAALALWLGRLTPAMVAAAALLALATFALARHDRGKLPFGPALAAAGWICGLGMEVGWWQR